MGLTILSETERKRELAMIRGIAFDMDGIMFDTERLAVKAWAFAWSQFGVDMPAGLAEKTVGLNIENTRRVFLQQFGSNYDFYAVRKLRVDYVTEYIEGNGMPIKTGLFELLDYLKTNRYKITVATTTDSERVRYYFGKSGINEYFDDIVCGDMVKRGKPEPDIYLKACEILRLAPAECLALEDSPSGILAAHKAGMKVVMIPDLIHPDDEIRKLVHSEVPDLFHVMKLLNNSG